jgi:hypothetical protein
METHIIDAIVGDLPPGRYRDLVRQVLQRLPGGWDEYRSFSIDLSPKRAEHCYAESVLESETWGEAALDLQRQQEQVWTVTLYPHSLDQMPDAAVMHVIAHELGHVASGMPCHVAGSDLDRYRAAGEELADAIAREWGFRAEENAYWAFRRGEAEPS